MKVQNRSMVITGAFGALGRVVTEVAASAGYLVFGVDVATEEPEGLRDRLGPNGDLIGGVDLSSLPAALSAMDRVKTRAGRLDVLINLSGGFAYEMIETGDPGVWERMHNLNVTTTLNATKAALPHLLECGAGRIVNVGAGAALRASAGMGPYAASKAAVHRLTESLADELKLKNVTVNAVLPSIIDTPANRASMPQADFSRWVPPRDLAAVILFLASEAASAVTGALIPVNGRV
jgi:NAD(P)-dependent dehydrogenase (short-subunit alcohol dehydrogenase family)